MFFNRGFSFLFVFLGFQGFSIFSLLLFLVFLGALICTPQQVQWSPICTIVLCVFIYFALNSFYIHPTIPTGYPCHQKTITVLEQCCLTLSLKLSFHTIYLLLLLKLWPRLKDMLSLQLLIGPLKIKYLPNDKSKFIKSNVKYHYSNWHIADAY